MPNVTRRAESGVVIRVKSAAGEREVGFQEAIGGRVLIAAAGCGYFLCNLGEDEGCFFDIVNGMSVKLTDTKTGFPISLAY